MADNKGGKGGKAKKRKSLQIWKIYEVSGNVLKRKNRYCPKCSTGSFLAQHKDRVTCGKCGYTEFSKK